MGKIMETTFMGYIGIIGVILGLYGDNGKEHGNYHNVVGYIYNGYIGVICQAYNLLWHLML